MLHMIDQQFGTWRGAIRLGLSYVENGIGMASVAPAMPAEVKRLVFVCHGNICRSAFADVMARRLDMRVASFGLSTDTGKAADPEISLHARKMGYDLSTHTATDMRDFVGEEGDYLLGMEARHMRRLAREQRLADLSRGLLGTYAEPALPHLHDPFRLNADYQAICLKRIASAVASLPALFPNARV